MARLLFALAVLLVLALPAGAQVPSTTIILSTTTSTQDSGDFMLAPETQAVIKTFGVDKYGQLLFVPIAGKKDEDF